MPVPIILGQILHNFFSSCLTISVQIFSAIIECDLSDPAK